MQKPITNRANAISILNSVTNPLELKSLIEKEIKSIFDYALYSSGNINMDHSAEVTGEVMVGIDFEMVASATVNGNITSGNDVALNDSATVNGDITAGGSIDCDGSSCGQISGTQTENASVTYSEPALDLNELQTVAQSQTYNGHDNYYLESEIDPENPPFPTTQVNATVTPLLGLDRSKTPGCVVVSTNILYLTAVFISGIVYPIISSPLLSFKI